MAEAEGSVATKAPMPTAARVNENAMMARRAVGSARHTLPAAEMFRNSGRRHVHPPPFDSSHVRMLCHQPGLGGREAPRQPDPGCAECTFV